ncbi:putative prefoldin subunit 5 [Triticum urartu]|uniref:Putative prefoldin subunit 5 n=1 Tax=Triticum urartu TaxID=4572 RepID=M7YJM4_TRIUA|nr:putative prefoldin subunit 5 [Triticum urartu]
MASPARIDVDKLSVEQLKALKEQTDLEKLLVPLTASLYVPGTLDDAEKVLVDVGTGYYIEKTMTQGKEYCERKINLLKSNFDELLEINLRHHVTDQVDGKI